jgi:KDO2-lipid IV(A) lauroyltransferase
MARKSNLLVDGLVYVLARLLTAALQCWPLRAMLAVARRLGDFLYWVDSHHRRIAADNIRRAFGAWTEEQVRACARRSFANLCMLAVETMFAPRVLRLDTWRRHVRLEKFQEALELLLRRRSGLILLTAHWGNWEVLGYTLAMLGLEVNVVARPLDNPFVEDWLVDVRQRKGQRMVAKKGATIEVAQALERGEPVALVADQDAGRKGVFVDFFGRPASTYKSIALLAMHYEVPIVVGCAQRLDGDFHFRITVQDIIRPDDWRSQRDPLRYITQRYTGAIEGFVRLAPDQYLWAHRRWKTRPGGEAAAGTAATPPAN